MAVYMHAFVSCGHCRQTAWAMLPTAPGFVAMIAASPIRFSHIPSMLIGGVLSISLVAGLAWTIRKGERWSFVVLVPVFLLASLGAVGLYGAIRM